MACCMPCSIPRLETCDAHAALRLRALGRPAAPNSLPCLGSGPIGPARAGSGLRPSLPPFAGGAAQARPPRFAGSPPMNLRTGRYGDLPLPAVFLASEKIRGARAAALRFASPLQGAIRGGRDRAAPRGFAPRPVFPRDSASLRKCAGKRAAPPSRVATRPPGAIRPPDPRGRLPRCRAWAAGLRPHPVESTGRAPYKRMSSCSETGADHLSILHRSYKRAIFLAKIFFG